MEFTSVNRCRLCHLTKTVMALPCPHIWPQLTTGASSRWQGWGGPLYATFGATPRCPRVRWSSTLSVDKNTLCQVWSCTRPAATQCWRVPYCGLFSGFCRMYENLAVINTGREKVGIHWEGEGSTVTFWFENTVWTFRIFNQKSSVDLFSLILLS